MGWFSSSSSDPPAQKTPDGGSVAPDRSSRQQCYTARDFFFDCLDDNGIIDPLKQDGPARSKCGKQIEEFENMCSKTWAKYFKEKRVMEYNRALTYEKIKKDDAEIAARSKEQKAKSGGGGLWS